MLPPLGFCARSSDSSVHLSALLIYHLVITDKIITDTVHINCLPSSSNLGFGSARQGGEASDGEEPGVQGDAAGAAGFLLVRRPRLRGPPRRWHGGLFISFSRVACGSLGRPQQVGHTITWEEFKKHQKEDELSAS